MSKKFYVTSEQPCAHCENGIIANPIWAACADEIGDRATNAETLEWFNKHDYYPNSNSLPPEEIECCECGGTGIIKEPVPLQEALEELGVLMVNFDGEILKVEV